MENLGANIFPIVVVVLAVLLVVVVGVLTVGKGGGSRAWMIGGIIVLALLALGFGLWSYREWPTDVVVPVDEAPADAVVEMGDDSRFNPAQITIAVGDTVEWINPGRTFSHTVTADPRLANAPDIVEIPPGAEPFDSGRIPPGESYRHTFDVPGVYVYLCQTHTDEGMVGTVIVE